MGVGGWNFTLRALEACWRGSLGMSEPWYIEKVDFCTEELVVRIHVEIRKSAAILYFLSGLRQCNKAGWL